MPAPRSLDGAVVAVVGVHGGLGAAIAEELRSRGARVVGAGRNNTDVIVDLRDAAAGNVLVDAVHSSHGRLDGVVNAAGIVGFGNLADTDDVVAGVVRLAADRVVRDLQLDARHASSVEDRQGFAQAIAWLKTQSEQLSERSTREAAVDQLLPWLNQHAEGRGA